VANKTGIRQPQQQQEPHQRDEAADPQLPPKIEEPEVAEDTSGDRAEGGGVTGFAMGLMQKGMSIRDNMKEKASALAPNSLSGLGSNFMGGITILILGRKEEEVPTPQEPEPEMGAQLELFMDEDQQD
jgi:hypothetical protein